MRFRRKSGDAVDGRRRRGDRRDDAEDGDRRAARPPGPFDADDLPDDDPERVDLGSLLIAPQPGRELRLQVDEASGAVQSVVLAGRDGALELRAFAAPRGGDLWSEARPQIAAEVTQPGGTATEREGPFGTELVCEMTRAHARRARPARRPGSSASTAPRWMLRATLMGSPATDPDGAGEWEDTIRAVAVRRGDEAMPVGRGAAADDAAPGPPRREVTTR